MKNFIYFVIGYLIILCSNSIINSIDLLVFTQKPNFVLIFLVLVSLHIGEYKGSILGLFLGLIIDITVGKYFGLYGLLFLITGYICGYLKDKIFKERIITILIIIIFVIFSDNLINIIISGFKLNDWYYHLIRLLKSTIINVFIAGLLFNPINFIVKKVEELW